MPFVVAPPNAEAGAVLTKAMPAARATTKTDLRMRFMVSPVKLEWLLSHSHGDIKVPRRRPTVKDEIAGQQARIGARPPDRA